jgi:two-component system LytT family response regulator
MPIRILIVEDEPLPRERLRTLLVRERDVVLVGECANGLEAVDAIARYQPDVVFLDVRMPGLDGFGVIEAVGAGQMPATVFVTAHEQYALRAFDVHALDYVLKPFHPKRIREALEHVRDRLERSQMAQTRRRLMELLEEVRSGTRPPRRLAVKVAGRVVVLRTDEIGWIEAAGNYVRLHAGNEVHLLRETLTKLQGRLAHCQFVRIHRAVLVNAEHIQSLEPAFHGDYLVTLRDGTELTLSRGYRPMVEEFLGHSL